MDWTNLWQTAFGNVFARNEFMARILERSFERTISWIELALAIGLALVAWRGAACWTNHGLLKRIRSQMARHIIGRITFPFLMLILGVVAQIAWQLAGQMAIWLRLFVLAANWMIAIRLVLAILRFALPENWRDSLERYLAMILWACFVLWISGLDELLIDWLQSLKFSVGASKLSVYTMLTGLLWVGVVMMFMMWLARWINAQLMASQLDINLRIVLSKIVKTLLMILSVLIALPLVGIDLTVLSVFGGALGVGLGFGLQKIASNYVSGFIILADRSIRPGDRLTVNNFTGYVTEITSRFVVLKSGTGAEAIIPNETFVTSTVINESYTTKSLYQTLDVQVSYQTNLPDALAILQAAAAEQERVGKSPGPAAFVVSFNDNGITLRVGFWVNDPENGFSGLFSAILLTIWRRFDEAKIEFR